MPLLLGLPRAPREPQVGRQVSDKERGRKRSKENEIDAATVGAGQQGGGPNGLSFQRLD